MKSLGILIIGMLCWSTSCESPKASQKIATPAALPIAPEGLVQTSSTLLESQHSAWKEQRLNPAAKPDEAVLEQLRAVPPGAQIDIFLGSWCGDSRREVARFFNVVDHPNMNPLPFSVQLFDLDRGFSAQVPGLIAVPTFIVTRDGQEVGRVVETSPSNIETELLRLLTGESQGTISATR